MWSSSSYYFFFGNGLVGIWSWILDRIARLQAVWLPDYAGARPQRFYDGGIARPLWHPFRFGWRRHILPLVMVSGISFLGTGLLYHSLVLAVGTLDPPKRGITAPMKHSTCIGRIIL